MHQERLQCPFYSIFFEFQQSADKKGRTLLTAFAGSIGIIGIALILSLSSGFQDYINDVQEQTLSSYPIEIQKQAMDYSDLLSEMTNNTDEEEDTTEHEEDKVYSGDVMGRFACCHAF